MGKTKLDYFCKLNVKDLNDNKQIWTEIKPFFLDNVLAYTNIALKERSNLITNNQKLANLFNTHLIKILRI